MLGFDRKFIDNWNNSFDKIIVIKNFIDWNY